MKPDGEAAEAEAPPAEPEDPLVGLLAALEARHRSELTFQEVRRALQALSSLYVERRAKLASGAVFDGAGKRAAFALYYGPLHFLLVREAVRGLGLAAPPPGRILDLGCGTGVAGAAWALEARPRPAVEGLDRSGWAVEEARFTLRQLGLPGRIVRGDVTQARWPPPPGGVVAAFTLNELDDAARARLLPRLLAGAREGRRVLLLEPLARGAAPFWPEWSAAFREQGGREDTWRLRAALPGPLALLAKAAGLDPREAGCRTLALDLGRAW